MRGLLIVVGLFFVLLSSQSAYAQAGPMRSRILACANMGAMNPAAMQACSGLNVSPPVFSSCVSNGPCFSEPPIIMNAQQLPPPPGVPFCGSFNLPYCPQPIPCGYPDTVLCPGMMGPPGVIVALACGAGPMFPPCRSGIACGLPGALPCPFVAPPPIQPAPVSLPSNMQSAFGQIAPRFNVVMLPPPNFNPQPWVQGVPRNPNSVLPSGFAPLSFVPSSLPDLDRMQLCKAKSATEEDFSRCIVTKALSGPGKVTPVCMDKYPDNLPMAVACSQQGAESAFRNAKAVAVCGRKGTGDNFRACIAENWDEPANDKSLRCAKAGGGAGAITACLLKSNLNSAERKALACAQGGQGSADDVASCLARKTLGGSFERAVACANSGDSLGALSCLGKDSLSVKEKGILACAQSKSSSAALAQCAGSGILSVAEQRFADCANTSGSNKEMLSSCMAQSVLGKNEQAALSCAKSGTSDSIAACVGKQLLGSSQLGATEREYLNCALSSNGDQDALVRCLGSKALGKREQQILGCATSGGSEKEMLACVGKQYLGENEQRYLSCATQNNFDVAATMICGISGSLGLNPEAQIAVQCAATSGGEPMTFAGCTAGQLGKREIEKCWEHGIATDNGCFGPNNTIRQFYDSIDGQMRTTLGASSDAYKAYHFMHNNMFAPGPNHEVVRVFNNGINDIRNGPGQNNEFVRAGNAISQGFNSIGNAIGIKW